MTGRGVRAGRQRGFALLIVLWLLVPLSVLFALVSGTARSDTQLSFNLRGAAELESAADGGISTAIFGLLKGEAGPLTLRLPGAVVLVQVASQSGLLNPNIASPELMRALLIRIGVAPELAERLASSIADWRTPGRLPRVNGAKAAAYLAAGRDYGPPDAPFVTLGELRDVLGMTPPILAGLLPNLTLDTERDPVPALAPPAVAGAMADLGLSGRDRDPGAVFRITAAANGRNGIHVVRRATVKLGFSSNRRGWRVLGWETAPES